MEIRDVAYVTKHSKRQIFEHVNIKIKPGEKILLMAPSGWGKTTLLRLMLGIYTPSHGEILINGEEVTGDWYKAHNFYSYVNQKPFMFDDTLRFNVTLGRQVDEEQLLMACHEAGLDDLIQENGLDYPVGENGNNLSGGQIQRVEIARAPLVWPADPSG